MSINSFEELFAAVSRPNKYTAELTDDGLLDIVREAAAKAVEGPPCDEDGWNPLGGVDGSSVGRIEHAAALDRIADGLAKMVEQHCAGPDTKWRKQLIRSFIQVAIGAGYHAALADKRHEGAASSASAAASKSAKKASRHDEIRQLYEGGMSQAKIARKLGCSRSTVSRAVNAG